MILKNVLLMERDGPADIRTGGSRILSVTEHEKSSVTGVQELHLDGALAFPGLINSHDHLDFNLFPQFGGPVFDNYTAWGKYIHDHYRQEISDVLRVPRLLREQWGIYKNLICGVTTVVNHGEKPELQDRLLTVYEKYYCLHSVRLEKKWQRKLNHPLRNRYPFVIHTGEGTDQAASLEIDELIRWNLFKKKLVGVHGVAMTEKQAAKFEALVWCPESNFFLLNKTAPIAELSKATQILFGTDSALTGRWDIWEHLRLARKTEALSDTELYHTVNLNPSKVWGLANDSLREGALADIVVARRQHPHQMDAFFAIRPKDILLVMHHGTIRLFDASLLPQLPDLTGYSKIYMDGAGKFVQGDIAALITDIRKYYPGAEFPPAII